MGENPSLEALLDTVRMCEEHGGAWEAYVEWIGIRNATEEHFEDCCAGSAHSEQAWLAEFLESSGTLQDMPAHLCNYFDYAAYLRDMKLNGDVNFENVSGTVYAFWNH